jgi:hypothetical protein
MKRKKLYSVKRYHGKSFIDQEIQLSKQTKKTKVLSPMEVDYLKTEKVSNGSEELVTNDFLKSDYEV